MNAAYVQVAHLVHSIQVAPHQVHFQFRSDCGRFSEIVTVERQATPTLASISAKPSLLGWVKAALRKAVRSQERTELGLLAPGELEQLTLRAFAHVEPHLALVEGRWVRQATSERPEEFFEYQLSSAPIIEPNDLKLLVRVLLETSKADASCTDEEMAFLRELVPDEALIARLARAPRLTVAELCDVSSVEVAQTILMLAWSMAFADDVLDPQEVNHLHDLARRFLLPEPWVHRLQLGVKLALLERYLATQRSSEGREKLQELFLEKARSWASSEDDLVHLQAWFPEIFPAQQQPTLLF